MSNRPLNCPEFRFENNLGRNATAIPRADTSSLSGYSGETAPALPGSSLGGSASRLQRLVLLHIPFPVLPKLLLSATHLVDLHLINIPHSGHYFPLLSFWHHCDLVFFILAYIEAITVSCRSGGGEATRTPCSYFSLFTTFSVKSASVICLSLLWLP